MTVRARPVAPKLRPGSPQLITTEFRNCCGLNIVHGFYNFFPEHQYGKRYSKEESAQFLKEYLEYQKANVTNAQASANIVALNGTQEERLGQILLDAGYVRVMNGAQNGKHDSLIYLYLYVFRPELSGPNLFPGHGDNLSNDY